MKKDLDKDCLINTMLLILFMFVLIFYLFGCAASEWTVEKTTVKVTPQPKYIGTKDGYAIFVTNCDTIRVPEEYEVEF